MRPVGLSGTTLAGVSETIDVSCQQSGGNIEQNYGALKSMGDALERRSLTTHFSPQFVRSLVMLR